MNISIDEYLEGFENSAKELPRVMHDWPSIDDDLKDEYVDQLLWLIAAQADVMREATTLGRSQAVGVRLVAIIAELATQAAGLRNEMGIDIDGLMSRRGSEPQDVAICVTRSSERSDQLTKFCLMKNRFAMAA